MLLNLFLLSLFLFKSGLGYLLGIFKLLCQLQLIPEFDFVCLKFSLLVLKPLFLLQEFLILDVDCISFICPLR